MRSSTGSLDYAVAFVPRTRSPMGSLGSYRLALRVAAADRERIVAVVVAAGAIAALARRARRRVFRGISCLCGLCSLCRRSRRAW